MYTTYLVENSYTGIVVEYFETLHSAKTLLKNLAKNWPIEHNAGVLRIVKLTGNTFGEGTHQYYCQYDDIKDKYIYQRFC
jgi:hypothetical protein